MAWGCQCWRRRRLTCAWVLVLAPAAAACTQLTYPLVAGGIRWGQEAGGNSCLLPLPTQLVAWPRELLTVPPLTLTCICSACRRCSQVLATYHGDHAYSFDITRSAAAATAAAVRMGSGAASGGCSRGWAGEPAAQGDEGVGRGGREGVPAEGGAAAAASEPEQQREQAKQQQQPGQQAPQRGPGIDLFAFPPQSWAPAAAFRGKPASGGGGTDGGIDGGLLPPAVERLKAEGNLALFNKQLLEAVAAYSAAIRAAPWAPVLYCNRALALLQRRWEGDAAAALADAELAGALVGGGPKALYR